MAEMKAAVIYKPGGPEVLQIETRPVPTSGTGQVLIRVMAFGLNRSEMFTRQGYSPNVNFPRILGIEAVGLVEEAPGTGFSKGDAVATVMGGMGRMFDGSYAEYTCVPAGQVQRIKNTASMGNTGRSSGDVADRLGLFIQIAPSREGRAAADPRRDHVGGTGRSGDCQEARRGRIVHIPEP